jgi:tripartite-type tricarboxylate transporter receptor subunit TctC
VPLLEKLSAGLKRIAALPEVRAKLATQGAEVLIEPPQEFAAFIRQDMVATRKVAADAGIRPD